MVGDTGAWVNCTGLPAWVGAGPWQCRTVAVRRVARCFYVNGNEFSCNTSRTDNLVGVRRTSLVCPTGQSPLWRDTTKCTSIPSAWSPTPPETADPWFEDRMVSKGTAPEVLRKLQDEGVGVDAPDGWSVDPTPPVYRDRSSTTNPDGSVTVRDRFDVPTWTPGTLSNPPEGRWQEREETRTYPPGTAPPALGTPPPSTSPPTVITEKPTEIKTCGLPGTPPCKIDETGTPDGQGMAVPDVGAVMAPILACVSNPAGCLPTLPALNWSFAMPTACGPIPLPAFQAWGLGTIDICRFQSTFHDLMSMVWVIGGLFGAIGLFWRKTLGVA